MALIKTVILSFLLTAAYAEFHSSSRPRLGLRLPFLNSRVVGGSDAEVGEFPYQISMQWGETVNSTQHFCGGSIIADDWILTAGHCIRFLPKFGVLLVKAGKHNVSRVEDSEQTRIVAESFVHERYPELPPEHKPEEEVAPYDIALLKLDSPLNLNERVSIIELPEANVEPSGQVTISGWGSISKTKEPIYPSILQKVKVSIVNRAACNASLHALDLNAPLHETNVCTGPLTGGFGACNGDSGGPLTSETENGKRVVGLASWVVSPCGMANGPSVFVKVSDFIDWILDTIVTNSV